MQKITPFLWFDDNAEEAMEFYVSVFRNSRVLDVSRKEDGTVFFCSFELEGQEFRALNGGPMFKFNEAISLFVDCEGQAEVDELWGKLAAEGSEGHCAWIKDKFGLWWQIVPRALGEMLGAEDRVKAKRALDAMMGMGKIDVAGMRRAFEGE